jgi:hypothetical protein
MTTYMSQPRVADVKIKPFVGDGEVYGWEITAEFSGADGSTVMKRFRSKGSSVSKALRVPIYKKGFVRNVETDPYTRDQWQRVFGEGRM